MIHRMKDHWEQLRLSRMCRLLGMTRQAYYQNRWQQEFEGIQQELVLKQVLGIRQLHPAMGVRKIYYLLETFMSEHQIKMGRDQLFNLLSDHGLLVRKRKRRVHTTNSFHWLKKYPNLIRNFTPTAVNQLWVSDITYWQVNKSCYYISLITDAFSHKVVGYHMAETLQAIETLQALKMAVACLGGQASHLIHHSDRGIQYCSMEYINLLKSNDISISMTENGDPRENAIAERVNGILKNEYLLKKKITSTEDASNKLAETIDIYNNLRPHMSIGNKTPGKVHLSGRKNQKIWKNYPYKRSKLVNLFQD